MISFCLLTPGISTFSMSHLTISARRKLYQAACAEAALAEAAFYSDTSTVVAEARQLAAANARSSRRVCRSTSRHSLSNRGSDGRCRRTNSCMGRNWSSRWLSSTSYSAAIWSTLVGQASGWYNDDDNIEDRNRSTSRRRHGRERTWTAGVERWTMLVSQHSSCWKDQHFQPLHIQDDRCWQWWQRPAFHRLDELDGTMESQTVAINQQSQLAGMSVTRTIQTNVEVAQS